ncbi:hypothetical protein CXB51_009939 [Gossypium anomalum]|uniref:NB-ARC domain-containing protein n=1 Tax=Gossypium anomalum TaxID=47600 RepID=A0A8J6D3K9_9ROSI|nr:hypothetical protein CXB51_009939 [Gossypium anomalum]
MGCGFCEAAGSGSVGTLIVECMVKPVGRQLDYVRRFHDNVKKFGEKKSDLESARHRLQREIEDAERQLLLIHKDVQDWRSKAGKTLSDMGTLEEEIQLNKRCLKWCPNWIWRYQLSKKAMKKTQDISELLEKFGRLGPVGYPDPTALPTIDFLCSKDFVFSKSSKTAFYRIIKALEDENINMIGLWGMGGAGKTTLVHEVGSLAQKLNLFDKVVITTVSQKPNFERIQDHIAGYIGFDIKNEKGRRSEKELWLRLKNEPRILIILDDIWESIDLKKKIGIPIGDDHKGCKVLLTTRGQQVCRAMGCQNVVQLDCLDDDEAWTLFEKKAGLNDLSDDSIKILANQIVKKCRGLPIAIVPLGSALKGKTHHEWQAAYRRLKDHRLTEIQDVNEENAYVCLEASFDHLKNMETKTCFLLCSLFPEDDVIYVENLVGYAWGLELYKGMDSIKDVRRVGFPYLKLLLVGSFMETTSEFFEGMKALQVCALNYQSISLAALQFHMNLRTLYLIDCELSDIPMLGKLKTLHILSLSQSDITELPTEAGDLENLRLLDLSHCYALRRITPNLIQRLSNLEELYLHGCSSLKWATENSTKKESYSSLSELNSLPKLVVISLDISSEHLPDGFVFRRSWSFGFCIGIERETWFQEGGTYPISRSLRIGKSVDACKQLFEDVESLQMNYVKGHPNLIPSLDLGFSELTSLDLDWSHSMQCLIDASKQQVPITAFPKLRKLSLCHMLVLEEMCNVPQPQGFLQKLEEFKVKSCHNMKVLFPIAELRSIEREGPSRHLSLQSLKIVEINKCNNLKYIFPMSVANSLGQLHTLKIKSCSQLEDIIQDPQVAYICLLQSLREVSLIDLPQLKGRDVNDIMLTQSSLQKLKVHNCPKLTHFIISTTIQELVLGKMTNEQLSNLHSCKYEELEQDQTSSQHHPLPICFPNLILIDILECESLKSLFPIIVARGSYKKLNAPNLQTLKIMKCFGMEEIIQDSQVSTISFQYLREGPEVLISMAQGLARLNEVKLINLPQLKGNNRNNIVLTSPSLHVLTVRDCPQLTPFIISTNIQELYFSEMTEKKQISNVIVPERRGGTSISNFEELFEYPGYNLSSLEILTLSELTELRMIRSGPIQVEYFQNLTELAVHSCRRLRYIFSSTIARNLPQLCDLYICNCEELEQIIEKDQTSSQHHLQPICFPNLSSIDIFDCENLKCLFPITLAHGGLPNLGQLFLTKVTKLEQVFEGDEGNVSKDEEKVIHLPQFLTLSLDELPNLLSFIPVGYHFVFPSLVKLRVEDCPNITTRFSVHSKQSVHAKAQTSQSVDEIIVEESATAQETAWPIGSDIRWRKGEY